MRLLIVGGSPEGDVDVVRRAAATADMVVAVDLGGSLCLEAGLLPSVVVGDLDSLPGTAAERLRAAGVPFEVHSSDKDLTDLDLAIELARRASAGEILVTAAVGARFDHSLGSIGSLARAADLRPMVWESHLRVCVLGAQARPSVRVMGEGATFSAIPVLGEATVDITGARWTLDGARLRPLDTWGISNVVVGAQAVVTVSEGVVVVLAPAIGGRQADFSYDD